MSSEPAAGEPGFIEQAAEWSAEDFAQWFRRGAAAHADAPDDDYWTVSFPPLLLNYEKDPVDQIAAHLEHLAKKSQSAYLNACVGVGQLVCNIPSRASPEYVGFLLRLAGSTHPPGFVRAFIRHIQTPIVQADIEAWYSAITTFVVAASSCAPDEELSWLTLELRRLHLWRPTHARFCILEKLKADPRNWLEIRTEFAADLKRLAREDPPAARRVAAELAKAHQTAIELEAMPYVESETPIDDLRVSDEVMSQIVTQRSQYRQYVSPQEDRDKTIAEIENIIPFPKRHEEH